MGKSKFLNGTVLDGSSSGPGLAGATVQIAGKTATTGSAGTFSITEIPAGTHQLTISKPGYATQTTADLVVAKDQSELVTYLAPAPPFTFSGFVLEGTFLGPGCLGATVAIDGMHTVTGSQGEFRIAGIPTGSYTLTIHKPGYLPQTVTGFVINGNVLGLVFFIHTAAPIYYAMEGTVRSTSGPLLEGAQVNVGDKTCLTNSAGAYRISGLLADKYPVGVSKAGYGMQVNTKYPVNCDQQGVLFLLSPSPPCTLCGTVHEEGLSGPGLAGATVAVAGLSATTGSAGDFCIAGLATGSCTLTISKRGFLTQNIPGFVIGGDQGGLQFALTPLLPVSCTMAGTVRSSGGQALGGAQVRIASKTATTAQDGSFSISGIPAGSYELLVTGSGYRAQDFPSWFAGCDRGGLQFSLTPDAPYTMSGKVLDRYPIGPGCVGAKVEIAGQAVTTNGTGDFIMAGVPAGSFTLTISKPGYLTQTSSGHLVNGDQSGLVFVLATAAPIYYSMDGMVYAAGRYPLQGAQVDIAGQAARTDSNGLFHVAGIESGVYALGVAMTGYGTLTQTRYPVNSDQSWLEFKLAPSPPYDLAGKVLAGSAGGPGCAGATLSLGGVSASSDSAGNFTLRGVAAGRYTLSVYKPGFVTQTIANYVVGGNQSGLAFVLSAAPPLSMSGKVLSGSMAGAPLAGALVSCAGQSVVTSRAGTYRLTGITPGSYVLVISKTGYVTMINTLWVINSDLTGAVFFLVPA